MTEAVDQGKGTPIERINAALDGAEVVAAEAVENPAAGSGEESTPPAGGYATATHGGDEPPAAGRAINDAACPITCLGVGQQRTFYFLGPLGDFQNLAARELGGGAGQAGLFAGRVGWLRSNFPPSKKGDRWDSAFARDWLMDQCSKNNRLFDPARSVRGPGAWRDGAGVIVHTGNRILRGGVWRSAGAVIGEHIYPAAPPEIAPAAEPASDAEVADLVDLFGTWVWQAPVEAPRLLLGFICQAFLVGALDWRAHIWVTGDKHTGKTTLLKLLKAVLGTAIVRAATSSEAGVRQLLGCDHSARAVELDEVEPEPGSRRVDDIVRLARVASNGGDILRGTTGGQVQRYSIDTCFLFTSIYYPRFLPQDAGRIAVLELGKLPDLAPEDAGEDVDGPSAERIAQFSTFGPRLYRRIVDGWPRLLSNILAFQSALASARFSSRVADQYGTLLALAETAMSDRPIDAAGAAALVAGLHLRDLVDRHPEESADLCIQHLMGAATDYRSDGGRFMRVGEMIGRALETGAPGFEYRRLLKGYGLKLVVNVAGSWLDWQGDAESRDAVCLAVANGHNALEAIFAGTTWERGVWPQALGRAAASTERTRGPLNFGGGIRQRAVIVPPSAWDFADDQALEKTDAGTAIEPGDLR